MSTLIGHISSVQDGTFDLSDTKGIAHQLILAYNAYIPEPGLYNLFKTGKKVLVTYTATKNGYTGIVHRIRPL